MKQSAGKIGKQMVLCNVKLFLMSNKGLLEDGGHEIDMRSISMVAYFLHHIWLHMHRW